MAKNPDINLPVYFFTEGTGGKPSSHKSSLASAAMGVQVEPVKVRGPEPSHISDPLELILSKWYLFHLNAQQDKIVSHEEGIEVVADVACGFEMQNSGVVIDARKETNVLGNNLSDRQKDVAKRVSARFSRFGNANVVAHMDAALVLAHAEYGERGGVVVASGVSESRIMLPGNPLKDHGLFLEYLDWAGLGEKQLSGIPWAVDMASAVGFLAYIDWWGKNDYVFGGVENLVMLPLSYSRSHADDRRYLNQRLDFFHAQGRLSEELLRNMDSSILVGLLSMAFNFPTPFVGAVVESMNSGKIQQNRIIYQQSVIHK